MLEEAIRSVLGQTRPANEIIVVSDGSTDCTAQVAASFGDRIRFVEKANGGKSECLNLALGMTKADYIWIMDDDDLADPEGLERFATALDENPNADVVFGTFKMFREENQRYVYFDPSYRPRPEEPDWKITFLEEMFTFQAAMLVRRSAYELVGPFNTDYIRSQGYEMTLRLMKKIKFIQVPKVIFYQRQHDGLRGAAAAQFSASDSEVTWLKYGISLFLWVREEYSLSEFTPSFARTLPPSQAKRAALVQRLSISANRALWNEVLADLKEAVALNAGDISPEEIMIAEAVPRTKGAWGVLAANPLCQKQLRDLADDNSFARDLLVALVRPLGWQSKAMIRAGEIKNAVRWWLLVISLVGLRGFMHRLIKAIR